MSVDATLQAAAAALAPSTVAPAPTPAPQNSQQAAAAVAAALPDLGEDPSQTGVELEDNFVKFFEGMTADEVPPDEAVEIEIQEPVVAPAVQPTTAQPRVVVQPAQAQTQQPLPLQPAAPVVAPQVPASPAPLDPAALAAVMQAIQSGQVPGVTVAAQAPAVAAQPQVVAQPQATAPVDPFALAAAQIQEQEAGFISALADKAYQIDPEQFQSVLQGDPKALSTLCARVHTNSVSSVMRTVAAYLPVYVNGLLEMNRASERREEAFWSLNPHLNRDSHRNLLPPVIQMVNSMQPNADEATRHKLVGLMVAMANGIPLQGQAPAAQATASPAVRTAPMRTPGPVVRTRPQPQFAPAGAPAAGNGVAPSDPNVNMWGRIAEYINAEDRGLLDNQS